MRLNHLKVVSTAVRRYASDVKPRDKGTKGYPYKGEYGTVPGNKRYMNSVYKKQIYYLKDYDTTMTWTNTYKIPFLVSTLAFVNFLGSLAYTAYHN